MHTTHSNEQRDSRPVKPMWAGVMSIFLGVFTLVASEFAPAGLLTPIATDLGITEGMAGQAISTTALVGLVMSLAVSTVLGRMNRKSAVLLFSALLALSNLMVALAPGMAVLITGRLLLGVSVGGLWSLAPALAARLVPTQKVTKALAIIFSGVSVATVAMLPVAAALETVIGWRNIFVGFTVLGLAAGIFQLISLPSMPVKISTARVPLLNVLRHPGVPLALATMMLCFSGHFAIYTYIRPMLQNVAGFDDHGVASILLLYGLSNLLGNFAAVRFLNRSMMTTLRVMPFLIAIPAVALVVAGHNQIVTALMIALWGFGYAALPVGWSRWITRTAADEPEAAGGLFVASSNLAVTAGVTAGGFIYDASGVEMVFIAAAASLVISIFTATLVSRRAG